MKKNLLLLTALLMVSLFRFYTALQTDLNLSGFSPLMALAFMGGWLWSGSRSLATMTLITLVLTDLGLNAIHGHPGFHPFMGLTSVCYLLAFIGGSRLQNSKLSFQFMGLVGSSIGFYLITNTFTWWGSPHYPQTFSGWVQSWTLGLPGYPPSYTFLRNALTSDILFWGVLRLSFVCLPEKSVKTTEAAAH
jgi:hypothetical protein